MDLSATVAVMTLVGVLAALCGILVFVLRRSPAIIWLTAGLCVGNIESFVMTSNFPLVAKMAILSFTVPCSFGCVAQSVRAAYGCGVPTRRLVALFFGLIAASLILLACGVPTVWQMALSEIAAIIVFADAMQAVARTRRKRDVIDHALFALLIANTIVYALRIPFYPLLIGQPSPFTDIDRGPVEAVVVIIFSVLVPASVFLIVARVLTDLINSYRQKAERDFMTDLPNRRSFEEHLDRERRRTGAMILCDIDNFKAVNDRFGHAAGDAVIRAFGSLIDGEGYAARIGGEEFAIWLPGYSIEQSWRYADWLRREFESLRVLEIKEDHSLTASFGIAAVGDGTSLAQATLAADAALYRAKNAGRNRVAIHGEAEPKRVIRARLVAA